jgi:hypothetical protein
MEISEIHEEGSLLDSAEGFKKYPIELLYESVGGQDVMIPRSFGIWI